jgi:hypothetical protein
VIKKFLIYFSLLIFISDFAFANADNPFATLDMWMSGYGDAGYIDQAQAAELLFCQGKKLPSGLLPNPRALSVATEMQLPCTLKELSTPIKKEINRLASDDSRIKICQYGESRKVKEKQNLYTFDGCIEDSDGSPFLNMNESFFWPNGKLMAYGKSEDLIRYGRWHFYSKSGKEIGTKDYYKGEEITKVGESYEVKSPAPKISIREMKSKL